MLQLLVGAERWFPTNDTRLCRINGRLRQNIFGEAHICNRFHLETLWVDHELHLWASNQHGLWAWSVKLLRKDEILGCLGYTVVSGTHSYYFIVVAAACIVAMKFAAAARRFERLRFFVVFAPFKELFKQLLLWVNFFLKLRTIIGLLSRLILIVLLIY